MFFFSIEYLFCTKQQSRYEQEKKKIAIFLLTKKTKKREEKNHDKMNRSQMYTSVE